MLLISIFPTLCWAMPHTVSWKNQCTLPKISWKLHKNKEDPVWPYSQMLLVCIVSLWSLEIRVIHAIFFKQESSFKWFFFFVLTWVQAWETSTLLWHSTLNTLGHSFTGKLHTVLYVYIHLSFHMSKNVCGWQRSHYNSLSYGRRHSNSFQWERWWFKWIFI